MSTLRCGVIGLGVGEAHIRGYNLHPHATTELICDSDPLTLETVGARYPGCRRTRDPWEVIEDPGIDAISVCSYDDVHHPQVVGALEAGKHVFVEKPLCVSRSQLEDIRTTHAARPDLVLSSNLVLRRSPRFVDLRERIRNGELGEIFLIEGDYNYGRLHKLTDGWRGRMPGYSVTLGGGVHIVDLILWLTEDDVMEVTAFGTDLSTRGTTYMGHDTRVALIRFASGMIGKVSSNFACVYPHHHRLSVYGTLATFENNPRAPCLYRHRDPEVMPERICTAYPGIEKYALIRGFVDQILSLGFAAAQANDIYRCMDVCLSIDQAVLSGEPVRLGERCDV